MAQERASEQVGSSQDRRRLIVLVGPESKARMELARDLMDRDAAVVLCFGPPDCALVHDDSCPLVDAADAVVVLPSAPHDRGKATALSLCVEHACNAVVMEPSAVDTNIRAVRIRTKDAAEAAELVAGVLRHPTARRKHYA